MQHLYDLIIIGGGPAGITAGIYAARKRLDTLLVTKDFFGQVAKTSQVDNYPGFYGIVGIDLTKKFKEHLKKFARPPSASPSGDGRQGIEIQEGNEVTKVEKNKNNFLVKTEQGKEFLTKSVIVASGRDPRPLEVPGEKELIGRGVSYCSVCLPPEESIVVNNSLKKIGEIGIAHKVLTMDGSFQDITQIMTRDYEGEMMNIKPRFFREPVRLTPNHPVLAAKVERVPHQGILKDIAEPRWRKAGELTTEEAVLYPIISEIKDIEKIRFSEILGVEVKNGKVRNNQETYTSHRISDEIPVNEKFLRLAGYYLAEGSLGRHEVIFYFNKNEKEYIDDVKNLVQDLFSLNVYLKTVGGVTRISVFSKLIKDLFYLLFGKKAPNKKIPHWMLFLPREKQKEVIKGHYRGDGHLGHKEFCIVTTSRTLAYQVRDILLRFGIIPSVEKREKEKLNKIPGEIGGRKIRFNTDKYHIRIKGPSLEKMSEILGIHHPEIDRRKFICHSAWIKGNYLYLPIREIKREKYRGKVCNLAVGGSNTYVAKNFIVHNCDSPFFQDKNVAVIGGGNAGFEAALDLAKYAKRIFIFERSEKVLADAILQEQCEKEKKIELHFNKEVKEIKGPGKVQALRYQDLVTKKTFQVPISGVFVQIGSVPATGFLKGLVEFNEQDEVKVDFETCQTSTPGIFAAGDVNDGRWKQIVIAAGEGCRAALAAFQYLQRNQ